MSIFGYLQIVGRSKKIFINNEQVLTDQNINYHFLVNLICIYETGLAVSNDVLVVALYCRNRILVDKRLLRNLRRACVAHDLSLGGSEMHSGS